MIENLRKSLRIAISELDTNVYDLNWQDNNGFFDKFKNGKAASSAEKITKIVSRITAKIRDGSYDAEKVSRFKEILNTEKRNSIKTIKESYEEILAGGGFKRTVLFFFSRKSNTEAKLQEAIGALNDLQQLVSQDILNDSSTDFFVSSRQPPSCVWSSGEISRREREYNKFGINHPNSSRGPNSQAKGLARF